MMSKCMLGIKERAENNSSNHDKSAAQQSDAADHGLSTDQTSKQY